MERLKSWWMGGALSPELCVAPAGEQSAPDRLLAWVDEHRRLLLGGVLLLYLAGFNGQWLITPDSAQHALLARHLVETGGIGAGLAYPPDAQSLQPGLAWVLAASFSLFGMGTFWPAIVLMWLLGLGGLGLMYVWTRLHAGRPVAVLLTCGLGVQTEYYNYAFHLLTDLPFAVGLLLLLLGYELHRQAGGWRWAGSVALMVAALTMMALFRSVYVVAAVAVGLAFVGELIRGPRRWRAGAWLGVAVVAVIVLRMTASPPDGAVLHPDERMAVEQLTTNLPNTLYIAVAEPTHLPMLVQEGLPEAMFGLEMPLLLGAVVSALVLGLAVLLVRRRALWGLLTAGFVAQILLTRASLRRYFLPLFPLWILGWWSGAAWVGRSWRQPWGAWAFGAMLVVWLVPNLVRTGGFILAQRATPFYAHYQEGRYEGIEAAARELAAHVPAEAVVITDSREDMALGWFSGRRVYSAWWVEVELVSAQSLAGHTVYLLAAEGREPVGRIGDLRLHATADPVRIEQVGRVGTTWRLYPAAWSEAAAQ